MPHFDEAIHQPGDGRGPRKVLLNGKPVERVVYADTRRGIVRYIRFPLRVDKHQKRCIQRTRRGKVEVVAMTGAED